jgi:anti-anti-sigma factor
MSSNTRSATRRQIALQHLTIRQSRERDGLENIHPVGEIDLCTAPVLQDALADVERRQVQNVLVDLSEVRFLALIGVQVLRTAAERCLSERRRLVLVAPTRPVQRVLSLADVTADIEIYVTLPSAMSALAQR